MSFKDTTWILLLYFITHPAWHSLGSVITAATSNSLSFINRAVPCCVVLRNILGISAFICTDEEFHMVLVFKAGDSHKEGLLFKMQIASNLSQTPNLGNCCQHTQEKLSICKDSWDLMGHVQVIQINPYTFRSTTSIRSTSSLFAMWEKRVTGSGDWGSGHLWGAITPPTTTGKMTPFSWMVVTLSQPLTLKTLQVHLHR